jgi:ADP-ribose pyrophosphatase YjhB (NUDIX family)
MTGDVSIEAAGGIDPERLHAGGAVPTEERTYDHDGADHCESDALGRAIVGLTTPDGRVLLVTNPDEEHAILPNAVVEPGEDWAEAAREHLQGAAGIGAELAGVELVRRVEHVVDADPVDTTHHVLFAASAPDDRIPDGLCADNDWELGWYDTVPYANDGEDGGAAADVRRFLGGEA